VKTAQLQPGGDALEKHAAFLHRQTTGAGHNKGKLSVV
jgi:hypothetical protein